MLYLPDLAMRGFLVFQLNRLLFTKSKEFDFFSGKDGIHSCSFVEINSALSIACI